jgi:DNA-binding CsgD family transcriptional regulator
LQKNNPLSKQALMLHTAKISCVFPELTNTELVTLLLHSSGLRPPRMSELMTVSKSTVNAHIENIRVKFQLENYEEVKQVCELRITLFKDPDRYADLFPEISKELYRCLTMICCGHTVEEITNRVERYSRNDVLEQIDELKTVYHVDFLSDLRVFFSIRLKFSQF